MQDEQQKTSNESALRKDIGALREELHQIADQKEQLFTQRSGIGKNISELITKIKQLKEERNSLTDAVKKAKEERQKITADLRVKIDEHKKLIAGNKDKPRPVSTGKDPRFLKKQIDALEFKIETEGMSFEKEQKMMKTVRDLRKEYNATAASHKAYEASGALGSTIAQLKKQADNLHAQIQEKAKQSQDKHEQLMKLSAQVDELRKQEGNISGQITEKKAAIAEKAAPLDEKRKQLDNYGEEGRQQSERQKKKKLSDLRAEVELKIKNKQKLTTQDLLILQSGDD